MADVLKKKFISIPETLGVLAQTIRAPFDQLFKKIAVYLKDISRINFFWWSWREIVAVCFCKKKFILFKKNIVHQL